MEVEHIIIDGIDDCWTYMTCSLYHTQVETVKILPLVEDMATL
jgi:hypothetical protein